MDYHNLRLLRGIIHGGLFTLANKSIGLRASSFFFALGIGIGRNTVTNRMTKRWVCRLGDRGVHWDRSTEFLYYVWYYLRIYFLGLVLLLGCYWWEWISSSAAAMIGYCLRLNSCIIFRSSHHERQNSVLPVIFRRLCTWVWKDSLIGMFVWSFLEIQLTLELRSSGADQSTRSRRTIFGKESASRAIRQFEGNWNVNRRIRSLPRCVCPFSPMVSAEWDVLTDPLETYSTFWGKVYE